MGKKNKQISKVEILFPYQRMVHYFLLYFSVSLGVLLVITPLLSIAKVGLVREIIKLILRNNTPYIHPIPYFKSISLSLPVFTGLFFAYRKVSTVSLPSIKKDINKAILCLIILWLIEIASQVLFITKTKLNMTAFLPNYSLTFLLSIGSICFPLLLWLIFFHPSFLD